MDNYEVLVVGDEIILPAQVEELFGTVSELSAEIKALEAKKKAIEEPLKKAMKKYGIDKFKCKYMTASTVKGSTYVSYDAEKMKADGVYEKYAMVLPKDSYVKITYKKAKDE